MSNPGIGMNPDNTDERQQPSQNESEGLGDPPRALKGDLLRPERSGRYTNEEPLSDGATELGREAAERIARSKDTGERLIADYPWWALGVGLAIGVVFGVLMTRD